MSKLYDLDQIQRKVAQWKLKNNQIVFTNGCFDILHIGHIHTLREAKKLGDKLIVGLNSDASVKRLKGESRPINNELNRAELLNALQMVDAVVLFEEDTPLNLIKTIIPNFLVKGGDWDIHQIVGADFVVENGGKVHSIPFVEGFSTTNILKTITNL